MKLDFSPRDTGACPLCRKHHNCTIQNSISAAYDGIDSDRHNDSMEMVIYVCPFFVERA